MSLAAFMLGGCAAAREAPRVELSLSADPLRGEVVQTNLGYWIELSEARLVLRDLEFAVGGEAHVSTWLDSVGDLMVPVAHAHTGHSIGGEVTGELRGRFVMSWRPAVEAPMGIVSLIAGDYESASFTLVSGSEADSLASDDPLMHHLATFRGQAVRDDQRRAFVAIVEARTGANEIAGVPFVAAVRGEMSSTLGLELLLRDPFEGDTLFDGIDFVKLSADASGAVLIAATAPDDATREAHGLLAGVLQTPDHFRVYVRP